MRFVLCNTPWLDTFEVSNQGVLHSLHGQASLYVTTQAYGHFPASHHHCQMFSVSPTPTREGA